MGREGGLAPALRRWCGSEKGPLVALVVLVIATSAALLILREPPFTGDEPAYLIQAESLWRDGDLDISDDVGQGTPLSQLTENTEPSTVLRVEGALRSFHPPGLAVLFVPAVAMAWSPGSELVLARLTIFFFVAIAVLLLHASLVALRPRWSRWAAALVCAVTFLSLAVGPWALLLYPDSMAFFCVSVVVFAQVARPRGHQVAQGLALAAMPWFSVRLAVLAAGLLVACALLARRVPHVPGAALTTSLLLLALFSQVEYGAWNPAEVYSRAFGGYRPTLLTRYRVGLGALYSRTEGLFVVFPLAWLGLLGLGRFLRRLPLPAVTGLLAGALYLVVVLPSGGRGAAPPPRMVVAFLPLLVVLIWLGASRRATWLVAFTVLSALGVTTYLAHLRSQEDLLALYGDSVPVHVTGPIPLHPRMNEALGTTGPSLMVAREAGATDGAGASRGLVWGPFEVLGGRWEVRSTDGTPLPEGLELGHAGPSEETFRGIAPDAGSGEDARRTFQVPGLERRLRATAGPAQARPALEFVAVRANPREDIARRDIWKTVVLVVAGLLVVLAGALPRPSDEDDSDGGQPMARSTARLAPDRPG